MCKTVSPEGLIAYLLKTKSEVSFYEIRDVKYKIEEACPEFNINITRESLYSAVMRLSSMFKWEDVAICRAEGSGFYFTEKHINEFCSIFFPEKIWEYLQTQLTAVA